MRAWLGQEPTTLRATRAFPCSYPSMVSNRRAGPRSVRLVVAAAAELRSGSGLTGSE
jgi:hypothetical protein